MAERGSRRPAGRLTEIENLSRLGIEGMPVARKTAEEISSKLREELSLKGLKGFKKGGKVKKSGVYKLHKGEKVITAKQAAAPKAAKKPAVKLRGRRI